MHRIETDWKACEAGTGIAAIERFEAWVNQQPAEYRRIYGHPDIVAGVIVKSKEIK